MRKPYILLILLCFSVFFTCKPKRPDSRVSFLDIDDDVSSVPEMCSESISEIPKACEESALSTLVDGEDLDRYLCICAQSYKYAEENKVGYAYIGKVAINPRKKKEEMSHYDEFYPSTAVNDLMYALKKAASDSQRHRDETNIEWLGCMKTPALTKAHLLGDLATKRDVSLPVVEADGSVGTLRGKKHDCLNFLSDWGKGLFKDQRQLEFVLVKESAYPFKYKSDAPLREGEEFRTRQCFRITGNIFQRSAIGCYKRALPPTLIVTIRPDSWKKALAPAPIVIPSRFAFGDIEQVGLAAKKAIQLKDKDPTPTDPEEVSLFWLKKQIKGARWVAGSVAVGVALAATGVGAIGPAMQGVVASAGILAKSLAVVKLAGLASATVITPLAIPLNRLDVEYSANEQGVMLNLINGLQWAALAGSVYGVASLLKGGLNFGKNAFSKLTKGFGTGVNGFKNFLTSGQWLAKVNQNSKSAVTFILEKFAKVKPVQQAEIIREASKSNKFARIARISIKKFGKSIKRSARKIRTKAKKTSANPDTPTGPVTGPSEEIIQVAESANSVEEIQVLATQLSKPLPALPPGKSGLNPKQVLENIRKNGLAALNNLKQQDLTNLGQSKLEALKRLLTDFVSKAANLKKSQSEELAKKVVNSKGPFAFVNFPKNMNPIKAAKKLASKFFNKGPKTSASVKPTLTLEGAEGSKSIVQEVVQEGQSFTNVATDAQNFTTPMRQSTALAVAKTPVDPGVGKTSLDRTEAWGKALTNTAKNTDLIRMLTAGLFSTVAIEGLDDETPPEVGVYFIDMSSEEAYQSFLQSVGG